MNFFVVTGLIGFLFVRLITIYTTNEHSYSKRDLIYSTDQMKEMNMTLGKFNNSFNFVVSTFGNAPDFDLLNNPYVEPIGYEYKDLKF